MTNCNYLSNYFSLTVTVLVRNVVFNTYYQSSGIIFDKQNNDKISTPRAAFQCTSTPKDHPKDANMIPHPVTLYSNRIHVRYRFKKYTNSWHLI